MLKIIPAQDGAALEEFITLSQEYVAWFIAEIHQHYPELDIAEFTSEHTYDDVRKKFPGDMIPPDGCLLIVQNGDQTAGCIALGKLSETICEMRTLFVRPEFRGVGAGRLLIEEILKTAREYGYQTMRLDTLGFMTGAQTLYKSYGFYDIDPYLEMSDSLKQYIHFLECKL